MSNEHNTRNTLLEKLRDQHDDLAWEEFTDFYDRYIFALLKSMGFRHQDCEDLLQEVLVKAWKALPEFSYERQKCRFRSWLTIVTRNTARSYLSSKTAKNEKLNDDISGCNLSKMSEPEIDHIAEREWQLYVTKLAWEKIEKDFSNKVLEVFLDMNKGRDISDIAHQYEVSESSVYVYKQRVQKAMAKEVFRLDQELG